MGWNLPQPRDARLVHRNIGVETSGHYTADQRDAFLLQSVHQISLLGDQTVDLGCFAVEEIGDGLLFGKRRKSHSFIQVGIAIKILDPNALFD